MLTLSMSQTIITILILKRVVTLFPRCFCCFNPLLTFVKDRVCCRSRSVLVQFDYSGELPKKITAPR